MPEPPPPHRVLAVATTDPFDVATFSGYSAQLFTGLRNLGLQVEPMATRRLVWHDLLTGAPNWRGWARGEFRGRRAPRINPDWYWSWAGFERFSGRFERALERVAAPDCVVQVGTHVRFPPGVRGFCITDATVAQAVADGSFSVSRARAEIVAEALAAQRAVFGSSERVLTFSQWARRSVIEDYGLAADRVSVLGAGANVGEVAPTEPTGARAPVVLFVGADWEQKGGPLVLAAFAQVRREVPGARLVVVGCTPQVVASGVEVLGPLSRRSPEQYAQLLSLYGQARVFCIAPRFDAYPNVLLEAGAHAAVVVSTDRGSRGEVVVDGVTGLLVPHDDPAALAAALIRALRDDALADRLGTAAAACVRTQATWPVVAARFAALAGLPAGVRR